MMRPHLCFMILLGSVFQFGNYKPVLGQDSEEQYAYDGFLEPSDDVMVSAVEIGRLEKVNVKVGDRVTAGQELARLEDTIQVVSLEAAEQLASMHGELDAAAAERRYSQSRVEQLRALVRSGNARPDELTRAETDYEITQARHLAAEESHATRALDVKRNQIQLERRRVISPITGVVSGVLREPGEYVSPGDSAIFRVISKAELIAVFNLPAADAMQLQVGQSVPLKPRTIPSTVSGIIESISPLIDGESGTVAVRVRLNNQDETLIPGDRCVMDSVDRLPRHLDAVSLPSPQRKTQSR